jgi:hypothetical protein
MQLDRRKGVELVEFVEDNGRIKQVGRCRRLAAALHSV